MSLPPDPYALCAAFYDAEFGAVEVDAAWFARHAASGPLLVLGCGTGRICRLLGGEREVLGLDRSGAMLELARARAGTAAPAARPTRWIQADMRDFLLSGIGETLIPNAGFNFLLDRRSQADCLRCVHRALRPGGVLALDLPMPDPGLLGTPHTPELPAWEGEVDGQALRRTREVFREAERGLWTALDRYFLDGRRVAESTLRLRMMFPGEVEWMLEAGGFAVDSMVGGYADQAVGAGSERILVRAMRV